MLKIVFSSTVLERGSSTCHQCRLHTILRLSTTAAAAPGIDASVIHSESESFRAFQTSSDEPYLRSISARHSYSGRNLSHRFFVVCDCTFPKVRYRKHLLVGVMAGRPRLFCLFSRYRVGGTHAISHCVCCSWASNPCWKMWNAISERIDFVDKELKKDVPINNAMKYGKAGNLPDGLRKPDSLR